MNTSSIDNRTPAVGEELVIRGMEVIVDRAQFLCEGCALRNYETCLPIIDELKIDCTFRIFVPKLEYLKRQMR